jgi:hypothetical protein
MVSLNADEQATRSIHAIQKSCCYDGKLVVETSL